MDEFKDKDLVYDVLRCLPTIRETQIMLVRHPNATVSDFCQVFRFAKTPDEFLNMVSDFCVKADECVLAELKKDQPNAGCIKEVCEVVKYYINPVLSGKGGGISQELEAIMQDKSSNWRKKFAEEEKLLEKYDFDKIMGGNIPYVSRYRDVEKQNERLEEKNKAYEEEITSLNNVLQCALDVIEAYKKGQEDVEKAGVFRKAAAEVTRKKLIYDANEKLKRAQKQAEKPKQALVRLQVQEGKTINI